MLRRFRNLLRGDDKKADEIEPLPADLMPPNGTYHRGSLDADIEGLRRYQERRRQENEHGIAAYAIQPAESGNDSMQRMQADLRAMTESFFDEDKIPQLLVHSPDSKHPYAKNKRFSFSCELPEFLDMNVPAKLYFDEHPQHFLPAAAHEAAHLFNGDRTPENMAAYAAGPPDDRQEKLADLVGAVIYSKPADYAVHMNDMLLTISEGGKLHINKAEYLEPEARGELLVAFTRRLEEIHALDESGVIIPDKREEAIQAARDIVAESITPPPANRPSVEQKAVKAR